MSEIIEGMATILWGDAWANHVEEHECEDLAGCAIEDVMPSIPEDAYRLAERIMGKIEQANDSSEHALFWKALKADGKDPEKLIEHERNEYAALEERFGECLVWMALGAGVSWFDDHERFDLRVPLCDHYMLQDLAERNCDGKD